MKNKNIITKLNFETKIGLLDWFILLSIILLLLIVYIPNSIWAEEKKDREESRFRMKAIANAAEFYNELKGSYTTDGDEMFALVEAAIDSLYADSLFVGEQKISTENMLHQITIEKGFDYRADTTFSIAEKIKVTVIDTIYMISEFTDSTNMAILDTSYVNSKSINERKKTKLFNEVISMEINDRIEVKNDYLRRKYHLNKELLFCPLTKRPYILEILNNETDQDIFMIKSPVKKTDAEPRYFFFKYIPGNHGYIKSGITSWAESN